MNEARFAATGRKSWLFSEQSAGAIESPSVNLKMKPSSKLNMAGMTKDERGLTVRASAASKSEAQRLSNKMEDEEDVR